MRRLTIFSLVLVCAVGASLFLRQLARTPYSLVYLGTLGGRNSAAYALNTSSQVVGQAETAQGEYHAFLWDKGKMTDLGTLGGSFSVATDINAAGQVVGAADIVSARGGRHAFLWNQGKMTDLGTLGGMDSEAHAINSKGQIVGRAQDSAGHYRAVLWEKGKITDLGTLGGKLACAYDINDLGQVVGRAQSPDGAIHAVLWEKGQCVDLGTFGGKYSEAYAINNKGQIVGWANTTDANGNTALTAFFYHRDGLTGFATNTVAESRARAINEAGIVIGELDAGQNPAGAVLNREGQQDLNRLSPAHRLPLMEAQDINTNGQIVGNAGANPQRMAYLLTPRA